MRRIILSTVVLAVAVSLAGCTASHSSSDAPEPGVVNGSLPSTVDGATLDGAQVGGTQIEGTQVEGAQVADDSTAARLADQDRSVVTTGTMTVTADDPLAAATDAVRIVEEAGGRVDGRTETAPTKNNQGAATLSLRVPSAALTATLDKLKALGKTGNVSLNSTDVTTQSQDLDARISALRASVVRLTALLATATDTKVLIELETAISDRQGNLESMEAQQRSLADQVSLSTIDLSIISVTDAPVVQPDTFWSGLVAGWGAFTGFIAFVLVAFGVLLPWIGAAALAALIALIVMRRRRARAAATAAAVA